MSSRTRRHCRRATDRERSRDARSHIPGGDKSTEADARSRREPRPCLPALKNFPHQYADASKIRAALETVRDLNDRGADVGDDGVLGEELARRGIHNLLGTGSFEQRLAAARAKPPSNQGFRTAAREMRRTFVYLGWLDDDWEVTPSGAELLATAVASTEERDLWREALLALTLTDDDGNASHPVRALLRLIADHPFDGRDGLELALEAKDDSEREFRRLVRLSKLTKPERLRELGVSDTKADDAKKILPALAEQAGLIERQTPKHPYTLTDAGKTAIGAALEAGEVLRPERTRAASRRTYRGAQRKVTRHTAGRRRALSPRSRRALTDEEQAAADRLLYERTDRHQELVRNLASAMPSRLDFYEDQSSYDFVAESGDDGALLLFEVKTLEGDEVTQVRLAVGQLLYYRDVVIPTQWPTRDVRPVAAFEGAIDPVLARFLDGLRIGAIAIRSDKLEPLNKLGRDTLRDLGL